MTFGDRLKELRLAKGLTQTQLAEATGLTQGAIGHWELGTRRGGPSVTDLFAICAALDVECSAFKGVTDAPVDKKPAVRGRPKSKE